jgi:threonine aldolase
LLQDKGASFYPWKAPGALQAGPAKDEGLYRFVTSFATSIGEINQVLEII